MCEIKERLDVELVKRNIFPSREKSRESILKGEIYVNGINITKCSKKVSDIDKVEFKGSKLPYVSRGGLKLEKAINIFGIELENKICFDIGASTGGFTDCMLQNGVSKVWAIDVGKDQLEQKLKKDNRVVSLEKTNIRYLSYDDIKEYGDFASIDVSFISLEKVIPSVVKLLNTTGNIAALIKPQFEAGKNKVGKHGVVKKPEIHIDVIQNVTNFMRNQNLKVIGLTYSPIKGPEGNVEYLVYCTKDVTYIDNMTKENIILTVKKAHNDLR